MQVEKPKSSTCSSEATANDQCEHESEDSKPQKQLITLSNWNYFFSRKVSNVPRTGPGHRNRNSHSWKRIAKQRPTVPSQVIQKLEPAMRDCTTRRTTAPASARLEQDLEQVTPTIETSKGHSTAACALELAATRTTAASVNPSIAAQGFFFLTVRL